MNENEFKGQDPMHVKLSYICEKFRIRGELLRYRWISTGHINMAYYAAVYDGTEVHQYLIQKVNWYVFKDPVAMMGNIDLITKHIMAKTQTVERRRRLHFHHTAEGNNYLIINPGDIPGDQTSEKEFWRLCNYIENSRSFDTAAGSEDLIRRSGRAFGHFVRQLADFDAGLLVESIPHFHDTRQRMDQLFEDVKLDSYGRVAEVQEELEHIRRNRVFAETLCRMIDADELPVRVTHNDTKINNIMFDRDTLEPLVIVDLDTCMPGLMCYDFGDAIRSGACTGREDRPENALDLRLFKAYTEGYINENADILTDKEIDSMVLGACIMTFELAVRFLDDYITGDKYFRIDREKKNLDRTRSQLSLFDSMMGHFDEMNAIVHEVAGR